MKSAVRALGSLLVVGLLTGCTPAPTPPAAETPTADRSGATVVRVVDGDTLVVMISDVKTTVRLLNVDTPETKDPNKPVQCLGPEASAFLTAMLPVGTSVGLEYDGRKLDRYGRTLAGVFLDDALVNAEIARAGLGSPVQFNPQVKFLPPVEEAAAEAKRARAGAFADGVNCALPTQ